MITMNLRTIYYFTTILSTLSNTLLTTLILTKSPPNLGAYKHLMMLISIFEILYSWLDAMLQPMHYAHQSIAVVLVRGSWSKSTFLHHLYWGFFGASLALFAIHFVYRYLVVSTHKLLGSFNSWQLIFWLMIPLLNGAVWMLIGFYLCGPSKEITEMLKEPLNVTASENVEDFEYVGFYLYEKFGKDGIVPHVQGFVGMMSMSSSVSLTLSLILFFGFKTYSRIKNLTNTSSTASNRARQLQSQLFYSLVIQTLIPLILLVCPVTVLCIFVLFNAGQGRYSALASICVAIYPAIDAFPSFFIISPYRKAILKVLCWKKEEESRVYPSVQFGGIVSKQS